MRRPCVKNTCKHTLPPPKTPPTPQVRALSDQNQAFVLRIKQLEAYVVDQKDAMRALQAQVAALAAQHVQHAQQPPGVARGREEPMRSSSSGGGGGGGAAGAVSSFPVNLTPSSSPERAGGLLGVAPAGDSGDAGAGGGGGGQQRASSSSVPSGGKFWSMRGGA
jgi:hypothetical protein